MMISWYGYAISMNNKNYPTTTAILWNDINEIVAIISIM